MNNMLTLRPVEDRDIQQLELWLNKEHILKWYNDADEWLNEIKERNGSFSFLNHFIVLKEGNPIGFGQYYDCYDAKECWYSVKQSNETFSMDYFIGEEACLQKGYGKGIIRLLKNEIYKLNPNAGIIVQPESENIASCKALLSNGFVYNETNEYYEIIINPN